MSINIIQLVRGAVKGALVASTSANSRRLLVRLLRDEAGSNLVLFAFLTPVLVGIAGFGTEGGLWLYTQQALQGAADSAAISAARAYSISPSANIQTQANAIAASYGFVNGTNGVTVNAIRPPTSGTYAGPTACNGGPCENVIEVTVTRSLPPLFSSLFLRSSNPLPFKAFAVAVAPPEQCILALDPTASGAVTVAFLAAINLTGCGLFSDSNSSQSIDVLVLAEIIATNGTVGTVGNVVDFLGLINPAATTGDPQIPDPYANVPLPTFTVPNPNTNAGCVAGSKLKPATPFPATTAQMSPGVYCNGISISNITATMTPGVYFLYEGALTMNNATLNGTGGVTLVFTGTGSGASAKYATLSAQNDSTVNLVAPTTGATAGMVMYGDRNMPLTQTNPTCTSLFSSGTNFCFDNGSSLKPTGAVYLPRGNLAFYGFSFNSQNNCTQIIADKINVEGLAYFADNCSSVGTLSISSVPTLVE